MIRSTDSSKLSTQNDSLPGILYQKEGRFTRELQLSPGGFGLGKVPDKKKPEAVTQSVCGFCGTGCNLSVHLQDKKGVNLSPTIQYPVNLGMACPKGWEALNVLSSNERATTPLLKNLSGQLEPVSWNNALTEFTSRFQSIQEKHGKESVAFLSTGQIPLEEMAFLGALTKFGMGVLHGDGNTRQCMSSAVVAYKESFGFDAPPFTLKDFEYSDVIILIGSNLCIAHPIMWERVLNNPLKPKIIVIDPRCTETAMQATSHYQIKPKSDQVLFYGIAKILIENNWIDNQFIHDSTNGFPEFSQHVEKYSLEQVSEETGISQDEILKLAKIIHYGDHVSFWWTMGVNHSYQGVRTAQSIINLALMTGNIGKPGTGANSITGQCNAMGSRLFSNTTNLLGGHDFKKKEHREKVAGIMGIDPQNIPDEDSLPYHKILSHILKGKIKGLWIIATNPAHSWINQSQFKDVLDRLDFLVVQDMFSKTATVKMADLVLPAAGWGEKTGTFINSERRIGMIKKVSEAPGEALADFSIFKLITEYWGCSEMFKDWNTPEDVFQTLKETTRNQPCDITGIRDYQMIDQSGGIQWPFPENNNESEKERRLFTDGKFFHEDQKAKFIFEDSHPMTEKTSSHYPFVLLTGRGSATQWHTETRTKQSAVLKKMSPGKIYVELNPEDAKKLKITPGEIVWVESQRGRLKARTFITRSISPGQLFIPMHYKETNILTDAVFDPYSHSPSYKACAVRIKRLN
jgi:anaerobic selenocysteine-containing dehydrogenase